MTPVELKVVLLTALLNPAVAIVAFWMARNADQWQKVPLAAFAGAIAGSVVIYFAVRFGLAGLSGVGRAAAGVFIAQFLFGLVWAYFGYRFWAAAVMLLRYWLAGTAIILAAIAVWALAPVLIFFVLLAGALGLASLAMIALARALQAWRNRQ